MPYDPSLYDDHKPDPDFEEPPFSSYAAAQHGPDPVPDWVVTDHNALDAELGVLKTGKEADVHLVRRALPGTDGTLRFNAGSIAIHALRVGSRYTGCIRDPLSRRNA